MAKTSVAPAAEAEEQGKRQDERSELLPTSGAVVRTVLQSADRTQMRVVYGELSAEERAAAQAELDGEVPG